MIISDEQVRRAIEYLKTCRHPQPCDAVRSAPVDVVSRAVSAAMSAPDIRQDRLQQAAYVAHGYLPDAESVAEKLLGRLISDSIR